MRHFNLETFACGELSRQINRDIEAVMRNVVDPNTDVKAKRRSLSRLSSSQMSRGTLSRLM